MSSIIFVIGCPRSGTSFITDYIGKYTDYCFNEPWNKYLLGKHETWDLPKSKSIVLKYCANCFYYSEIKKIYPKSKWIHVVRNPINVLYSMVFPKKNSYPKREWIELGSKKNTRIMKAFEKWKLFTNSCFGIKEAKIIKYEKISENYTYLQEFLEKKIEKPNFIDKNKEFDLEKMNYLKKYLKINNNN